MQKPSKVPFYAITLNNHDNIVGAILYKISIKTLEELNFRL